MVSGFGFLGFINIVWLRVYYVKIPIYPILYLLKGDNRLNFTVIFFERVSERLGLCYLDYGILLS